MRLVLAAVLLLQAGSFGARMAGARALDVDAAVERAARKFMSDPHAVGLSAGV